jgi:hypothetical protein
MLEMHTETHRLHVKCQLLFYNFNHDWNVSTRLSKTPNTSDLMQISLAIPESLHEDKHPW